MMAGTASFSLPGNTVQGEARHGKASTAQRAKELLRPLWEHTGGGPIFVDRRTWSGKTYQRASELESAQEGDEGGGTSTPNNE